MTHDDFLDQWAQLPKFKFAPADAAATTPLVAVPLTVEPGDGVSSTPSPTTAEQIREARRLHPTSRGRE